MPGVRVNSRAELKLYLRENPIQLKAARPSRPLHVNHPDFVGPVQPGERACEAMIQFGENGGAFFVVRKAEWERARDARILKMGGLEP